MHFPWCLAKCPYCDFVSYARERGNIDHRGYADAVIREIDARAPSFEGRVVESVFFGGGTPSLWDAREIARVIARVRERLSCASDIEVTVECNPTSIDQQRAARLLDAGVNRVSIGVQALHDDELRYLGRLHDARGAIEAVRGAMRAGIARVSADLIFGLPNQSPRQSRDDASALADLGLMHLSCYQLTIEPGTRFGELAKRGRLPLADDGAVADAFLAIDDVLTARGFSHYEISNYAQPRHQARHNVGYWRGDEYMGVGCAAYGFVRTAASAGQRWRNAVAPERYVGGEEAASIEPLDADALTRERIMLGLRMEEGIDLGDAWTPAREREAERLIARGRLLREGTRARIPRASWLWADDTAARLF